MRKIICFLTAWLLSAAACHVWAQCDAIRGILDAVLGDPQGIEDVNHKS